MHQEINRKVHIELLRIIAIFFVIFNHTGERGFFLFADKLDSPLFPIYIFLSVLCKIAVPIFYMITGALLLRKEESIRELYGKRVFRYLIVLVIISFLYWRWMSVLPISKGTLRVFWVKLYSSQLSTQLWFMYSYLGVLIMLPLLRRLVISMREKDYIYLIVCHVLFTGVIPITRYYLSYGTLHSNSSFSIPMITTTCVFYVILGYYLEQVLNINRINKKWIWLSIFISIICIGISCYMTMFKVGITGELNEEVSQTFHNSLISIPTISIYVSCKYIFEKHKIPMILEKILITLGSTVFGIFLMEKMLRTDLGYIYSMLEPVTGQLPACILWIIICLLVGFCITYLLKKIPFLKRYL